MRDRAGADNLRCIARTDSALDPQEDNAMSTHAPLIASLAVVFGLAGCGSAVKAPQLLHDDPGISSVNPMPAKAVGIDPYPEFNRALIAAQKSGASNGDQLALLRSGMSLITYNCVRYFDRLALIDQNSRFVRKETTLAGGLAASTLGLAGATSKALANTATLFAFGVASLDNYSETYVFSPEVKVVEQLVMSALDVYVAESVKTFSPAANEQETLQTGVVMTYLARMEASCQPHGVRDLVNKALNNSKAESAETGSAANGAAGDSKPKTADTGKAPAPAPGVAASPPPGPPPSGPAPAAAAAPPRVAQPAPGFNETATGRSILAPTLRSFSIQVAPRERVTAPR